MKKIATLTTIVTALSITFSGCGTLSPTPRFFEKEPKILLEHKIEVLDAQKKHIKDVILKYTTNDELANKVFNDSLVFSDSYTIKAIINSYNRKGVYSDRLKEGDEYLYVCDSELKFSLSKEGYYPIKSSVLYYSSDYPCKIEKSSSKIIMYKPSDYFNHTYYKSLLDKNLKNDILKYLKLIQQEGYLAKSILQYNSINNILFKNKKYLQLKFQNSVVYNSIQLNKYDIGKKLFDKLIRKILNPLNILEKNNTLYGYDIIVFGYTKRFTDKYASDKKIEYRFLIPSKIVKKYKDKDITGQELLDLSIILIDDERVTLKLQ